MFSEQEQKKEVVEKFSDENFLGKVACRSGKLYGLNLQLQNKDKHLLQVTDKIISVPRHGGCHSKVNPL